MRYKIENYEYEFRKPPLISEDQYYQIKIALERDKNMRISPRLSYGEVLGPHIIFGILIIIGFIWVSIDEESTIGIGFFALGSIWLFISIIMRFTTIISFMSFVTSFKFYYYILKKKIIQSKDYSEFKKLMQKYQK